MRRASQLLALATVLSVTGCGGGSSSSTVATITSADSPASDTASVVSGAPSALAFAKCMRASGVPNFPDPNPGGNFTISATGIDRQAPAFRAAQARCGRLMPGPLSGLGGGSNSPHQQAQALAQLRTVAQCMRQHGVSNFPDPRTAPPPNVGLGGQYSEITNYEGVWILFPATIDMQSPAWVQAAAACGPLAESFNHPHH